MLKQVEPQRGARSDLGRAPTQSRGDFAREAGMSPHQQKQALRVANVPVQDFEAQVESNKPPTLSALASQGIKPKPAPLSRWGLLFDRGSPRA